MKIKCIYCLKEKNTNEFRKREHVIPQMFGTFKNNLVLHNFVCDKCNQYFGDTIELALGRDTIEGIIMRAQLGMINKELPKKFKRLKFKIPSGDHKGKIARLIMSKNGELQLKEELQVGIFNKEKQEYDYFQPEDIPESSRLKEKSYIGAKIKLIANTDSEEKYIMSILKEKGLGIKLNNKLKSKNNVKKIEKVNVLGTIKIDPIIYRSISKIAFNYLAYNTDKEFVLKKGFDGIRNFIRYGKGKTEDYFEANIPPILYEDRIIKKLIKGKKATNGHLVILESKGTKIISKISIFNLNTYLVKLCPNYEGIIRLIKHGHHFDISSKMVSNLIII
ncbi:MAG: HNH endonuclease [Candidatus Helarchaeota archaeon]